VPNTPDHIKGVGYQKEWWTLSQRIRTVAQMPFEAEILGKGAAPVYQQIASKAFQMKHLGMSDSAIAGRLGVTDKTVAKSIAWFRRSIL
jgi:hypothetical protein